MKSIKETELHLANLLRAGVPIIGFKTWEENRVIDVVKQVSNNPDIIKSTRSIYLWSESRKLVSFFNNKVIEETKYLEDAIKYFNKIQENAILILCDAYISSDIVCRILRDTTTLIKNSNYYKNIVMISPTMKYPVELEKDITIIDFPLPGENEIEKLLDSILETNLTDTVNLSPDDKSLICKAVQGLTLQEIENAFALALIERKKLTTEEIDILNEEKCQIIKKTGLLEFITSDLGIDDIGGLENLKCWLKKRNNSWLDKAKKEYNLPAPKGVLITGVPGCGKSLTAKAMSSLWKLPLLRLDAGKIFDKWVGGSEENIRSAIKTAEAVAPSILWIDEIEKGFSQGGGESATTSRVFGTFLTWMQEKTASVFVVATANNINFLPAEMLRKGRFDEIFFVDIPTPVERAVIFKLHLNKILKGSISEDFEITDNLINTLVEMTDGFVGAEIEQAVISAVFEAFAEDRKLQESDLYIAIRNTVSLSVTQSEQIKKIREWAKIRAVPANAQ